MKHSDVSNCQKYKGSATLVAQEIRHRIYKERNLTASAGIAPNKFIAKIASDWNKPSGQFVVTPDGVDVTNRYLKVEKIWGVKRKLAERLHSLGLVTCADVQKIEKTELIKNW